MKFVCDDIKQEYYWKNDNDEKLSPIFDYEADAIQWRDRQRLSDQMRFSPPFQKEDKKGDT